MIYNILAVFIGSGIGGVFRWAISQWLNGQYPLGTFAVNAIGCFLIGLLTKILPTDANLRMLLLTGFCGGFTTFSTFMNENIIMMRGSQLLFSIAYIILSLSIGLLAAWLGYRI